MPAGAEEYKAGEEAIKKGDMDTVITSFEAALAANPDLFLSHYYLGYAYRDKQNWVKTAEHFVAYLDKANNDPKVAEMISNADPKVAEMISHATREGGMALAKTSEFQQAAPLLEKAASAKPNDAEVHFTLGKGYMKNGNEPQAQKCLTKVIQLKPNFDAPYYYVGNIDYNKKNWSAAKEKLGKYVELKPDGTFASGAHYMLGIMAYREAEGGNAAAKTAAKTHLNKFLQLKPDAAGAPEAHYILGGFAFQVGDVNTTRMHYQKYLQLKPSGPQAQEIRKFLADLK
jgi:tetratricopeptide (TPR) repeat protein